MTDSTSTNAEDLFPRDDISADVEAERVRDLKPWHMPRKQWIRMEQWASIVSTLLGELKLADRPLKYLTLPGEDMFDIRVLHDVCEEKGVFLKFLAFDSSRKTNVNIASDEVFRLPHIHKSSHLYPDRIELICQPRSLAFEHAKDYSGFDAINLDFCDSVGSRDAGTPDSHLDAIRTVLRLQTEGRAEPWVLFVTTRADRASVKQSVRSVLADLLLDNAATHESFKQRIAENPFSLATEDIEKEKSDLVSLDEKGHLYSVAIGFSKWLIRLAPDTWHIQQERTAGYRIAGDAHEPDLLSLAFRFDRINPGVVDKSGLVPTRHGESEPIRPNELDMVSAALDQYNDLVDVDLLLHEDSQLRQFIIRENAELMSKARFSFDEVEKWGHQNCWEPASTD